MRARMIACELLDAVLLKSRPLDQALEENAGMRGLPGRDRAFVRMAVATALRRMGQIDDFLRRAMERDEPPKPPSLHNLLRLAAAQIAFMDVPDYAVVDTAVQIAGQRGMHKQKGLVNAVLRRVAAEYRNWLTRQDEVTVNIPEWLMKSWIADYGLRPAAEIGQASLVEAPLDITVKTPDMLKYWEGTLGAAMLPTGTLRRAAGGAVQDLPGYDDGQWWVQDAAAAIPAHLLGDVTGMHIVDLCAAPGGKTAQLAAMGAQVTAVDRSAPRMARLKENMARLKLSESVRAEVADGNVWQPKERVSAVLLDAPCSATGTLRRHPDLMRLKTPKDVVRLVEIQERLLNNALAMLEPGGLLIYCTCSLQKEESERQIENLLAARADVEREPVQAAEFGGTPEMVTPQGDVRILPCHFAALGGMDGFYIARLRLKK